MNEAELLEAVKRAQNFVRFRKFFEAELLYRQLLAVRPVYDWAHYSYGLYKLLQGEYAAAWPLFETRFQIDFYRERMTGNLPGPRWDGSPIPGRTIFIHQDQGKGDLIQMARWIPKVCDMAGRVVMGMDKGMPQLIRTVDPRVEIISDGDPLPLYDVHLQVYSLAAAFGATLETIPAAPYLSPDHDLVETWRARFDREGDSRLKVGLVWQGNPEHPGDYGRSLPLSKLMGVLAVKGVRFIGLQPGEGGAQMAEIPEGLRFENIGPELVASPAGMRETASAIAALDLVIAVDTAVIHVTGAIGKEGWVMVSDPPDWRWLMDRDDSPWYPSLRVFRQPRWGVWEPAIAKVKRALEERVAQGGR